MKKNNQMFWLYTNMKNYKNIACTEFMSVNIALNLHLFEEN